MQGVSTLNFAASTVWASAFRNKVPMFESYIMTDRNHSPYDARRISFASSIAWFARLGVQQLLYNDLYAALDFWLIPAPLSVISRLFKWTKLVF